MNASGTLHHSGDVVVLFLSFLNSISLPFVLSPPPTILLLPPGSLIKTNATVGYHFCAKARRGWWDHIFLLLLFDDVILFSSEIDLSLMGSVYLSSPFSLSPLFPLSAGPGEWSGLSSTVTLQ